MNSSGFPWLISIVFKKKKKAIHVSSYRFQGSSGCPLVSHQIWKADVPKGRHWLGHAGSSIVPCLSPSSCWSTGLQALGLPENLPQSPDGSVPSLENTGYLFVTKTGPELNRTPECENSNVCQICSNSSIKQLKSLRKYLLLLLVKLSMHFH